MATVDTDNIAEMPFDVSKFSITTTPPTNSRSSSQINRQSDKENDENGYNIVLETAEHDDQNASQSNHRTDYSYVKQSHVHSNGHRENGRQDRSETSDSQTEDLEPKEHSANHQSNSQAKKHVRNDSNGHAAKSSDKQTQRKSSEAANDIEALKAKAHAERVARKAAKEAKKAQKKGSQDDSTLLQPRNHRGNAMSASAPSSPVDSPRTPIRKLSDRSISKHKLLAPPPIQSSRNNVLNQANGSLSPMSPPSPYLSPTHPKRQSQPNPNTSARNIFGWSWLKVLDRSLEITIGKNLRELRSIAPKSVLQHPYVLAGATAIIIAMFLMRTLGIRLLAPIFLIFSILSWSFRHSYVSLSILGVFLTLLAVKNRRSLVRLYQAVFLPPLTNSFPDCFEYEEVQLADQPKELIAKWAKEIDQHNVVDNVVNQVNNRFEPSSPSAKSPNAASRDNVHEMYSRVSGAAALALMQSYQQGELEDCEFHCLRVYSRDAKFFSNSTNHSKNNSVQSENDDTMGFVFISIKKHYDVSPTILKIFTPIQVCFPWICLPALWSQRFRRLCTFRFGVIGFQWAFRGGVFFTKPVDEFKSVLELDTNSIASLADAEQANEQNEDMIIQVARTAAFISIAKQFDASRPAAERCDFLLYTCATASPIVNAITASGGAPLPILPTYVADLRCVKGQDWQAYKRHLRHQNRKVREGPFENAGGHADHVQGKDMSDEDADTLVSMWHKVAGFRTSRDATSCLMAPTTRFVHELTRHESGFVDFLALRLNQTLVAASLLFSLSPEVLTSDIAGFNYDALEEAGRKANQQIKAYPVKLAAVLKHGIANGYEYVDFGPTTGPSKMELGCQEVPLIGGLFYHGALTSIVVSLAACAATSRHTVASR